MSRNPTKGIPGGKKQPFNVTKFVVRKGLFADSLPFETDDGDASWWSGQFNNGVAAPLAGAVQALAVAVAIAGSFTHQDELSANLSGGFDQRQQFVVGEDPQPTLYQSNDEFIVPAAPAVVEEELGWSAQAVTPQYNVALFQHNDEFKAPAVEESEWQGFLPTYKVASYVPEHNDELVAQAPVFIPEEDYWFQLRSDLNEIVVFDGSTVGGSPPFVAAAPLIAEEAWRVSWLTPPVSVVHFWHNDEAPPRPVVEETEWQAPVLASKVSAPPTWDTDDIPPQPAGAVVEETEWQGVLPTHKVTAYLSLENDEIVPQPATGFPEEAYWFQLPTNLNEIVVFDGSTVGGSPAVVPVVPLQIVESDWQVYTPFAPKPNGLYRPDPETEYPLLSAQQGASQDNSFARLRQHQPALVLWAASDEFPQAVPLRPEIDQWNVVTPTWPKPVVTVWNEDDVPVPIPQALPFDEPWNVWTQPILAAKPLYLPDPEEIPAGSLVAPPVVVDTPSGKHWKHQFHPNKPTPQEPDKVVVEPTEYTPRVVLEFAVSHDVEVSFERTEYVSNYFRTGLEVAQSSEREEVVVEVAQLVEARGMARETSRPAVLSVSAWDATTWKADRWIDRDLSDDEIEAILLEQTRRST